MNDVTFVTGNQAKADYLSKYFGYPIAHKKVDLSEIQSLDLSEIVTHKVKQAYKVLQKPVLVEDVSLEFHALGRLPGTFIKFFLEEIGENGLCSLVDGKERSATARCVFGYYDGASMKLFEGSLSGNVAKTPTGSGGYGWDKIFIPEGYNITRAEMTESDDKATYLRIKPLQDVKNFLISL